MLGRRCSTVAMLVGFVVSLSLHDASLARAGENGDAWRARGSVLPAAVRCTTTCARVNPDGTGGGRCTGHVSGSGSGRTVTDACSNAKSDANRRAGAGWSREALPAV